MLVIIFGEGDSAKAAFALYVFSKAVLSFIHLVSDVILFTSVLRYTITCLPSCMTSIYNSNDSWWLFVDMP